MVEIPYPAITIEEAMYLLKQHDGYFDADRQMLILPDM